MLSIFYDVIVTKDTTHCNLCFREKKKKLIKILKNPIGFEMPGGFCYNIGEIFLLWNENGEKGGAIRSNKRVSP
jgi:hypothetical protein